MSTRSVIAVQHGDSWLGRYCHSDGYPTHHGHVLWNEVKLAGVPALEAFLQDRGEVGISFLTHGFLTNPIEQGWDGLRYSEGYTHRVYKGRPGEEDTPTAWLEPGHDLGGTEWVYVATQAGLLVGVASDTDVSQWLGLYRYDQSEPDWVEVEGSIQ